MTWMSDVWHGYLWLDSWCKAGVLAGDGVDHKVMRKWSWSGRNTSTHINPQGDIIYQYDQGYSWYLRQTATHLFFGSCTCLDHTEQLVWPHHTSSQAVTRMLPRSSRCFNLRSTLFAGQCEKAPAMATPSEGKHCRVCIFCYDGYAVKSDCKPHLVPLLLTCLQKSVTFQDFPLQLVN